MRERLGIVTEVFLIVKHIGVAFVNYWSNSCGTEYWCDFVSEAVMGV